MLTSNQPANFEHFILMRFNVRTKHSAEARDAAIRSEKDWLDRRFDLFERICLPTIAAQSTKKFVLHVYFDAATPQEYLDRFLRITSCCPYIKLITCECFDSEIAATHIRERLAERTSFVLTTRLDNDDGLNHNFVQNLQRQVRLGKSEALNFPSGLVLARGAIYGSEQHSNAFISVFEDRENLRTVLQTSHNQLSKVFSIRDIAAEPMWLQHVHGGNISNKVRGRRLPSTRLPEGFESIKLASLIKPVAAPVVALENATIGNIRAVRDRVAQAVRALRGR